MSVCLSIIVHCFANLDRIYSKVEYLVVTDNVEEYCAVFVEVLVCILV